MSLNSRITSAVLSGPFNALGRQDPTSEFLSRGTPEASSIKLGTVVQFNVGLYSALVTDGTNTYSCFIGALNVTPGFGYSEATLLREGDEVIFHVTNPIHQVGVILAKKPALYVSTPEEPAQVVSRTNQERRTSFCSSDCYRRSSPAYATPLKNPDDPSTLRLMNNRPTDIVPGELAWLNQHRCGLLGGILSTSLVAGGAHIRLFSLENRIRIVADSIIKHSLVGNEEEWHNRRYLSHEKETCLYQEERLGQHAKQQPAFEGADYHTDGYFTKNKVQAQQAKPRVVEHTGFFGNLFSKYCLRPDPDLTSEPRSSKDRPTDPGVTRESIDPSGQYRFAATGMISSERIGRIPVPVRIRKPWQKEAEELSPEKLEEFKHDDSHPYYRQLELADRVAFDLKNSYARTAESDSEFYVPEEEDLENKVHDSYDPGFSDSTTVKLQKYDKRRSGIWQGEDGSIIIRDAWGSEIVMIGGNIQLSCAGNIEQLPGKSSLTIAGDDIIHKAQNSIDIEAADKDVRINAVKNVQIMAGIDESHPGGVIIESKGPAAPWDASSADGGEQLYTSGIVLKAADGNIVTDTKNIALKAKDMLSIVSGEDEISGGSGKILISASSIYSYGDSIISVTEDSAMMLSSSAILIGDSALLAGTSGAAVFKGEEVMVPLMWVSAGKDIAQDILDAFQPVRDMLTDESKVSFGFSSEKLAKMTFKFRSSQECNTEGSWELMSGDNFTLYEPFWSQVATKFETLKGVGTKGFEDHTNDWPEDIGNPWPGTVAVRQARYAKLASDNGPENMADDGLNKPRSKVKDSTSITEVPLFPNYKIRE